MYACTEYVQFRSITDKAEKAGLKLLCFYSSNYRINYSAKDGNFLVNKVNNFSKISVLFFFLFNSISSQFIPYKFDRLTTDDGLSQNTVYSIVQDQSGFMWFGTEDGLNKYDGYEFTIYQVEKGDSLSLSANTIYDLTVDMQGKMWIAQPTTEVFAGMIPTRMNLNNTVTNPTI